MARDYVNLHTKDMDDIRTMARANSSALHYSTKTPTCESPTSCMLCMQSARLAVQHYRLIIETRVVKSLMDAYGIKCDLPHPGGD